MQHQVPSAAPGGSEASCPATQPDFPGSTSGCHQLPVPCSVPAELQPQEQPRNILQQKNPRRGETRHSEHHSCAAGMHPLPHSTHCTLGQPQPPAPLSHLSGRAVLGCRMTLDSSRAGTCRAQYPAAERSGCSIASSLTCSCRAAPRAHGAMSVPTHETDGAGSAQQFAPTNSTYLP